MASTQSEKDEETRAEDAEERADAETSEDEEASASASEDSADDDSADDDAADDDAADDDAADDDSADADDAADDDADAASAAGAADAAPTPSKGKGGKKGRKKDGMTAGARLAAAKAAKAARKAAKRGKEKKEQDPLAQVRESELAKKAQEAGSWAAQNRNLVLVLAAVLLLGLVGWVGWSSYSDSQAHAAGALLADAVEIAQAEIVPEDEEADEASAEATDEEADPDAPPTFPTEQARAEAALEAYRRVLTQYGSSDAAVWARLGEARALATLGRQDEAREAYQAAEREGGAEPGVVLRALEGRAFTFEAEQEWDQALEIYQQLSSVDDRRYQPVAQYHIARMYIAKGERERATETLRELVEDLGEAEENDEEQDFAFVLAQAETRLRELDPSAAPPSRPTGGSPFGGMGAGPGGQLSNEQLQELIRQFQQKQQQGGGAE